MGRHLQTIHGHKITAPDDASNYGLKHLAYKLSEEEAKALFAQAENGGDVQFTDEEQRQFRLIDGENGGFEVVRIHENHGWF